MSRSRELSELKQIARTVAASAATLLEGADLRGRGTIESRTNHRDLVTEWDTRLEVHIRSELEKHTPEIPILGEESGASGDPSASSDWWMVDPIDGTFNFAHGLPLYGISIGLTRDGDPAVGVVSAPAIGREFHGHRGGGAFEGERAISVSAVTELEHALLVTGFPPDRSETSHNFAEWEHFMRTAGACRRLGAASLDLCLVASGALDGYWETKLSPWDVCAGAVIVSEAGGEVTDITGGPLRVRSGNVIASNGAIHRDILSGLVSCDSVIHQPGKDSVST